MAINRELRAKWRATLCEAEELSSGKNFNRQKVRDLLAEADRLKAEFELEESRMTTQATAPPRASFEEESGVEYRGSQYRSERRTKTPENAEHRAAFLNYLRTGDTTQMREYRDMAVGVDGGAYPGSSTGFFVPVGFVNRVEEALKYYGDMLNVGEIMETATGQPLPFPTSNDTTIVGEMVAEASPVSVQDVNVGQIVLGAYKFSTKMVKVSLELLQDSAFDIERFLVEQFAIRLGRILNTKFTTGSGTNEPKGIMVAATASGQTVIGDDNATTPDNTTEIGYTDLVNLEHSVDILYRRGAKWMLHDVTLAYIKKLKDKYGRPLWLPSLSTNAPDTILGYPYSINNDMDNINQTSPASARKTLAFGRLDKFLIRRVKDMTVLRLSERFIDYGQLAFLGFARYDSALLDAGTHPVKYLVSPAS